MCILASGTSELSNTIVYATEAQKPGGGVVHVLGYQNRVRSESKRPNAMILPIPAVGSLGPENVIDSTAFPRVLKDYAQYVVPRRRGITRSRFQEKSITFDSGSYTVALARTAQGLREAVDRVPETRKPTLSDALLQSLVELYPGWPMAVCCFNEAASGEMEPILWWYTPKYPQQLFAPAIDAHDGGPPQPQPVVRDHSLIFGSYRTGITKVYRYSDHIPHQHQWMFTNIHTGGIMVGYQPNGDFVVPLRGSELPEIKIWSPFDGSMQAY